MTNRDDYCRSTITNFSGNRIEQQFFFRRRSKKKKKLVNPLDIYQTATHYKNILPTITAFCDLDADIKYIVMIIAIYRHHKKALRKIL